MVQDLLMHSLQLLDQIVYVYSQIQQELLLGHPAQELYQSDGISFKTPQGL
jgi:hypothetical protein